MTKKAAPIAAKEPVRTHWAPSALAPAAMKNATAAT